MSKIVVVSDNHGLVKELEEIHHRHKDEANFFIHCGDSMLSTNHPVLKPYICVSGNCDYSKFPKELLIEIEGKKILILHGHRHSIKYNYDILYNYAKSKDAEIVLYGHTHYPETYLYIDITFINPGSIYSNRGIKGKSYAVVEIENNKINVKHLDVATGHEYKLKNTLNLFV